jgi:hypothetical protein
MNDHFRFDHERFRGAANRIDTPIIFEDEVREGDFELVRGEEAA